jgi:hypothetical protein
VTLQADILRAKNAAHVRAKVAEARGVNVTEKALHRAVAEYLALALTPPDWFTSFPLGSGGKARGGQLKAAGTKAGTPDILIIRNSKAHWIELKTKRGTLSDHQRIIAVELRAAGCEWAVCRSVDEVEQRLTEWGFNLRAGLRRAA